MTEGFRSSRPSWFLSGALAVTMAAALSSTSVAAVKKVPYPQVKVTLYKAYKPDAAFAKMRTAFADAVASKDINALAALIAPTFVWTVGNRLAADLDLGRNAIDNFKVTFGFRAPGQNADGGVKDGPDWEALAAFAADPVYYADTDNVVCGPMGADIADDNVFDQAREKVETGDDGADWYFTLGDTKVAKAPGDAGAPIAQIGALALPALGFYPPAKDGEPAAVPTAVEVLLPSGQSGWIAAAALRPLSSDRLCYARTPSGDWKIGEFDQLDQSGDSQ